MGQKRPRTAKPELEKSLKQYPPFKGTKEERTNLELLYSRYVAYVTRFSQDALSMLILGVSIALFLYYILGDAITIKDVDVIKSVISPIVFLIFLFLAIRKLLQSVGYSIKVEFISRELGITNTSFKRGLDVEFENFLAGRRPGKLMKFFIRKAIKTKTKSETE